MELDRNKCERLISLLETEDIKKKEAAIIQFQKVIEWSNDILTISNM
jgi:hypothetical protein